MDKISGVNELPVIYLNQGEYLISNQPCVVKTTLGSCISLVLYQKKLSYGGICHAKLPRDPHAGGGNVYIYVDTAIKEMLRFYSLKGMLDGDLEAKIFGGANLIPVSPSGSFNPGKENTKAALQILNEYNISPLIEDTGKNFARRILFYPHTGEILVKKISNTDILEELG